MWGNWWTCLNLRPRFFKQINLKKNAGMSILVYIEQAEGKVKRSSLEAVSFAKALSEQEGGSVVALALGATDRGELEQLGPAGAEKVLHLSDERLSEGMIMAHAHAVAVAFEKEASKTLVLA